MGFSRGSLTLRLLPASGRAGNRMAARGRRLTTALAAGELRAAEAI